MKVLLIYSNKFSYNPTIKTLEYVDDVASGESFENVQVAFIHLEQEDMEKPPVKAFINFIKWVSRKNEFKRSFFIHLDISLKARQLRSFHKIF
ncbi:MAG: threonyl-tRNA synthetase editing domain-containing protein [Saprospiraceae bacterium]